MKTWLIALGIWCTSLTAAAAEFRLSSPDIAPGGTIANKFVYKGFGCSGENVSPSLSWTGAPAGTRSFALLVHDADAPTGGAGWWHWLVYNIPAGATKLAQGAGAADGATLPAGSAQARTDFGSPGWGGPCPPLYALKVEKLDVAEGASASLIGYMANANALGKAKLLGLYGR